MTLSKQLRLCSQILWELWQPPVLLLRSRCILPCTVGRLFSTHPCINQLLAIFLIYLDRYHIKIQFSPEFQDHRQNTFLFSGKKPDREIPWNFRILNSKYLRLDFENGMQYDVFYEEILKFFCNFHLFWHFLQIVYSIVKATSAIEFLSAKCLLK